MIGVTLSRSLATCAFNASNLYIAGYKAGEIKESDESIFFIPQCFCDEAFGVKLQCTKSNFP